MAHSRTSESRHGTFLLIIVTLLCLIHPPPSSTDWLTSVYKNQWFAMLRTEFDNDNG